MTTIVIMPGGFHPFHAGHMSLYNAAKQAFPNSKVYVAATNDQKERPFPFAIKEKLAKVAGVDPGHFVQVKSPFRANEITDHYDPEKDVLIFVRSEKDKNESPKPGGIKKDGNPAYFQPLAGNEDNIQPFGKHAYFAYLPTIKFGPGISSATEIRNAWPTLNEKRKLAMVMSLYPATQKNLKLAQNVVKLLDAGMGVEVAEATVPSRDDDSLGYLKYFKQPDEKKLDPNKEKRFYSWDEYEKDKQKQPAEVEEARIIDANAKVNLYYVTRSGQRQIVFQNIPQRMLDKAIMVLRSKYPQIKDTDIEMRPANPESMVDEGISLNALSKFANIIPSFAEKIGAAAKQESKETWQMLQILKLKMQGKATPEQVQWMNKQWRDLAIIAVGVGLVGHAAVAGAAAHGVAAGISHGAKDALLHSLGDIGLEAAAEVLATKFGIDIVKKLSHSLTTSTGQGHEHEQEKAPQQYGVSPAVAAKNQQDLERKFQQAKMGFGGMSESEDYLEE